MFDALPVDRPGHVLRGRHSQAVDDALDAAREADLIGDVDAAAATLLRSGAWALDAFEAQNKPYGPSKLLPAMSEALRDLRMTPEARNTETETNIGAWMAALGRLDADGDAPVSDPAN